MGPYGPIWVARGEKQNVKKVKQIISDSDFFLGLCRGDAETPQAPTSLRHNNRNTFVSFWEMQNIMCILYLFAKQHNKLNVWAGGRGK